MSKRALDLAVLLIPLVGVAFIALERVGLWDHVLGPDRAEEAASQFDRSYAPDASAPVRPSDPDWEPLIGLVKRYSRADLITDRSPAVIARFQALASNQIPGVGTQVPLAEWTAPGTPLVLMYKNWPGASVPPEDYRIVGTIGDLHTWIERRRADLHSNVMDFILTFATLALALAAWFRDRRT
jgi:hypothetical protein